MRVKLFAFIVLTMFGPLAVATENPDNKSDENVEFADWGIRNGCIANMHIKRIRFISSTTGLIDLSSGRSVKVTLRNHCSGIRTDGYVHKPINNRFCEGDMLRVINYGHSCVVDTLEPYISPKTPENTAAKASGKIVE